MKNKKYFFVDVKKRKICKGKDCNYNTLIIDTEKLKWNPEYKNKCIQKFLEIIKKRNEMKLKRFVYTGPRKRYFSSKINTKTKGVYISRTEVNIIGQNEKTIKIINEIKQL